ncbi:MAG TPA: DHA2 family efflux MFS transporter permease subunit [Solirubrobacteraceae bacterium]|nr:DHA2 family efflux MFS transporter permease subunit [Solirubrobacteraceae bacterium]
MQPRWKVLLVVSVAVFMASLDLFIVNIAFPEIARDFGGADVADLSWVLNAYAIVFAALLVAAGRLADRVGRRRGFLAGLLLFLAGSALSGAAPSLETLIAARVLQATGAAVLLPTSLALLLPEFRAEERATAIGIWAAVGGIAAAAGPPIGGLLVEGSWRLVFLVNVPIGLVTLALGVRVLRESRDEDARWPDWTGAAVLSVAVGSLALGLVKAPEWGWGDTRTLAAFAVAAAGLAWFWSRTASHPSPVVDRDMLRVRSFALANVAALLFFVAFAAMLLAGVLFMTGVWGDSVLRAGLQLAPGPLMAAVFAASAGRAAERVGQRTLAGAGAAVFAAGTLWWLWQLDADATYAAGMLPGMLVTGVGVGLVLPSLASAAAASLPPTRFATGSAVFSMSRQLGSVLGVAVLVAILGTDTAHFDAAWAFMSAAAALASLAAFAIGPVRVAVPLPRPVAEARA